MPTVDTEDLTTDELRALLDAKDAQIETLKQNPVLYSCPGDEAGPCEFKSPTLAGVCPDHQTHVA